jgi:hypothetical protein
MRRAALRTALLGSLLAGCGQADAPSPDPPVRAVERGTGGAPPLALGTGERVEFEPAAAPAPSGALWAVWLEVDDVPGSVDVRCALVEDGAVRARATVAAARPLAAAPHVAAHGSGAYVVWEEGEEGARRIAGAPLALEAEALVAGALEEVSPAAPAQLEPRLADGPDGLDVVWQALDGLDHDLFTARRGPGGWSAPRALAATPWDEWRPRPARLPGGDLLVVFERFDGTSFDVHAARVDADGGVRVIPIARTADHEAWPDVAVAPGGAAWIAWERAPAWGEGGGLRQGGRRLGLARLEGGALEHARTGGARGGFPRVVATDAGPLVTVRRGKHADPDGTKRPGTYPAWTTLEAAWDAPGARAERAHPLSQGGAGATEALARAGGDVWCVRATDDREERFSEVPLWGATLEGRWRVVAERLAAPAASPVTSAEAPPALRDGASPERGKPPGHRAPDEPLYGDLHRHTDLSRCAGAVDGTQAEAYRFARGPGDLDFVAVTDHYQHMTPFSWWRSLRDVRRHHAPGSLVTLPANERMLGASGHFNVLYASPARGPADLEPGPGPREGPGDPLLVPHMTGLVDFGFDWTEFSSDAHRVVEIYQGRRGSYEGPGLPLEAPDSKHGPGSVAAGLAAGAHFGLIASSDHDSTGTSYAGLRGVPLTREAVLGELRARRTFAATARGIDVDARIGALGMGEAGAAPAGAPLVVSARGPSPIASVTVYRDGVFLARAEGGAEVRSPRLAPGAVRVEGGRLHVAPERPDQAIDVAFTVEWSAPKRALALRVGDQHRTAPLRELPRGFSVRLPSRERVGTASSLASLWRIGPSLGATDCRLEFPDPRRRAGATYHARIAFEDGNLAWTSPIRVDALR